MRFGTSRAPYPSMTATKGHSMTIEEMIKESIKVATTSSFYHYDAELIRPAIEEGLQDGDKIGLGGHLVAHVEGDSVRMVSKGKETANIPTTSLSGAQVERMLILKGAQRSNKL